MELDSPKSGAIPHSTYISLLMVASDAIFIVDEQQQILFWNNAAETLWGYTSEEVINQSLNKIWPNGYSAIGTHYFAANAETNTPQEIIEITKKDGSVVPVSLTTSGSREEEATHYMVVLKDITTEQLHLKNLHALQQTVDTSFAQIEFDPNGNILDANQNFATTLGYHHPNDFIGQHHSVFVDIEYKNSREYAQFWADLRRGATQKGEFKRLSKDGKTVWIQAAYTPIKNSAGEVVKIIKIATDITTEKATALNMQALRDTIDTSFARIEFDAKGNILDANQNFATTLGYHHPNDFIGQHHSIFVNIEYKNSREYTQFWTDLGQGRKQDGEFCRVAKNGQNVWILASYTPVVNSRGEVTKVIKIASDISKQKEVVSELNRVVDIAAKEGRLDARLNLHGAKDDWKALIDSVNLLLDSIAAPITEVGRMVKQIAHGDLTATFNLEDTKGEIKILGEAFNEGVSGLNVLLGDTTKIAKLLKVASEEMLMKGDEMKNTTKEVASATQQMAEGAQQQAQQTDQASKLMDDLLRAANNMGDKAALINTTAKEGQARSAEGLETVRLVVENMNEIESSASSTSESISILSERSEEIASTLRIITDIAAQTNLLALNAAIEAARAGDAGRGFAVVAEEIRKLAEGSRKSAIDIERVIREVQKDVTSATKAIEAMTKSVKSGNAASKNAEKVFKSIETSTNETFLLAEEIVQVTFSQKESISTTVESIEKIVVVSEETASGTEQIASSSKILSQGMSEITATSQDLADVANQLQISISKFKL